MSENITEVKAVLTVEDRATAHVKSFRAELDKLAKSLKDFSAIKTPDISTKIVAAGRAAGRAAVEATKAQARALGAVAGMEAKAASQRATYAQDADRQRQRIAAATMRDAREKLGFTSRMARQRAGEEQAADRQRKAFHSAAMAEIRSKIAFSSRMAGLRVSEERTVERERQRNAATAERDAASSLRRQIAGHRYLWQMRERQDRRERADRERDRKETIGRAHDAGDYGRRAVRDFTRPLGTAALAAGAAGGVATKRILGAESDVDSAEINTRIYGGLDKDAARRLREQWAAPLAESLGTGTDKLLTAWVDATKLGIPAAGAQAFAELSTKTSEAWSVPFAAVTDILGTVNTLLTSKGEAFSADRLRSVANTLQHLAAKQSTTPEKLMSFLQRGAGAAQVLGMSQEGGLAFGSASTSLGNQAGQSGRMFDYLASRVIEMPRLTKQKGDQGKQARDLVRALGYGSAEDMDRQRRADPDAFLPDFLDRFNKIKDTKKQDQAIRFFTGREWLGEFGRMVKGIDTYREAVKLQKEAKGLDAIGAVWELHRTKLGFVFKQFRAGWLNVLGEFGTVLSPMARQAGDTFLAWTAELRSGGLKARFRAMIDGFIEGLGFRDLSALMEGILGKPGEGAAGAIESWRAAARGFGQGLRDVVDMVTGASRLLSGGSGDPETLARWTARIGAFSAALLIASPAITVLGGITSAVMALGSAALTAWGMMKIAGMIGGGATAAAAGASTLRLVASRLIGGLVGGLGLALVAEIGSRRGELATMMLEGTKSLLSSMVQGVRDALAEWTRGGLVNGFLRFLDPNFAPDPAKPPAETPKAAPTSSSAPKTAIPADKGTWATFWDWLQGQQQPAPATTAETPKATTWREPPARTVRPDPLRESLLTLDPALAHRLFPDQVAPEPAPRVERQSFNAEDWRSMIQPAAVREDRDQAPAPRGPVALEFRALGLAGHAIGIAFLDTIRGGLAGWHQGGERPVSMGGDAAPAVERLTRTVSALGATIRLAAYSEAGAKTLSSFSTAGSAATTVANPVSPNYRRGGAYTPEGMKVPGWYGGGGGVTAPMLKGEAAANAKTAFDFFKSKGLSTEAASGILASMKQESGFNPQARGDGGRAHGLFQHHPDRRAAIQRATGIDMSTASVEKQLEGTWWEMNHGDGGAQRALRILQRPGISAREAGGAFVQHFERPARDERASRGAMAEGFAREFGDGGKQPGQSGPVVGGVHPLDGKGRLSSDFGMREHPVHGGMRMHKGIDLAAPAGTMVKAMRDGIASLDRSGDVTVKADDGSSTTYRHIQAQIAEGAKVAAGQVIGKLRAHDPRSTGPHLHLESRNANGELMDPKRLLARTPSVAAVSPEARQATKLAVVPKTDIGDGMTSTGWRKAGELADGVPRTSQTPEDLARKLANEERAKSLAKSVPTILRRPAGSGGASGAEEGGAGSRGRGGNGGGSAPNVSINIQAGNQSPQEMAAHMNRHLTEALAYRSHDIESELL